MEDSPQGPPMEAKAPQSLRKEVQKQQKGSQEILGEALTSAHCTHHNCLILKEN